MVVIGLQHCPQAFSFVGDELVIDTDTATAGDYTFRTTVATDSHGLSADAPDEFTITLSDYVIVTPTSHTYA